MDKIAVISDVLEYIETNLTEDIKTDDIANQLLFSKSSIEKLFKFATNISIKDYTIRRRMSKAAKDLENSDITLLDLAMKYGYGSNEAFSRAFRSVWMINPSEYRKNPNHFELFPAVKLDGELLEEKSMFKRKYDISELYDIIKERANCYFVCIDIKNLIPTNEISCEAGDIAILTALKRLENAAGEDDIVFRVGGDEFVALTNSEDAKYAENIINEVLSHNGELIDYKEAEVPLSLYAVYCKRETKPLRYSEFFTLVQDKLNGVKQ